jgi:hypothetical protein
VLARRLLAHDVAAPGSVRSGWAAYRPRATRATCPCIAATRVRRAMKNAARGALVQAGAATVADGDEIGGRYCVDLHAAQIAADVVTHDSVQSYAVDPDNAAALWAKSEEMVGERF